MIKKTVLIFTLIIIPNISFPQCSIQEYLLGEITYEKKKVYDYFSDTSKTIYFKHKKEPQFIFDSQKLDKIDQYSFKLKKYNCVDSVTDNYCTLLYRKDKMYAIIINLYFPIKDSTKCKDYFNAIIKYSKVEQDFPFIRSGTSDKLLEVVNGKTLELADPKVTPFYEFFRNEKKDESIKISYTYSNMSKEYELCIMYLNQKIIK